MTRIIILLFLLLLLGCAEALPTPARTIQASELARFKEELSSSKPSGHVMKGMLPLAIKFHKGDRIPVKLFIRGNVVKTPEDAPPAELIVERSFTMIMYRDRKPHFIFEDGTQHDTGGFDGAVRIAVSAASNEPTPLSLGFSLISE